MISSLSLPVCSAISPLSSLSRPLWPIRLGATSVSCVECIWVLRITECKTQGCLSFFAQKHLLTWLEKDESVSASICTICRDQSKADQTGSLSKALTIIAKHRLHGCDKSWQGRWMTIAHQVLLMYWQDKWITKQSQCPKIPDLSFLPPSCWGIGGHTSHKDTSLSVLDSLSIKCNSRLDWSI